MTQTRVTCKKTSTQLIEQNVMIAVSGVAAFVLRITYPYTLTQRTYTSGVRVSVVHFISDWIDLKFTVLLDLLDFGVCLLQRASAEKY